MHPDPHPLAGQTVQLADTVQLTSAFGRQTGGAFWIEDWQDRVFGGSWMAQDGNRACLAYAMRSATAKLPLDDDVVYGKDTGGISHIVHSSELLMGGEA